MSSMSRQVSLRKRHHEDDGGVCPTQQQHHSSLQQQRMSARYRFLAELKNYASDDDENEEVGVVTTSTTATSTIADTTNGISSLSFFETADAHASAAAAAAPKNSRPARVGLGLLHAMHAEQTVGPSEARSPASPTSSGLKVVETYVPLTSGGFLDTTDEHCDLRTVKVGDVLCRRHPPPKTTTTSTFDQHPSGVASSSSSASPSQASPTTTSAPQHHQDPSSVVAAAKSGSLLHFRKEADLTADERTYGKTITSDMISVLFEVSRLDRATQTLEAVFLDGTRAKLNVYDVRPAGFVEKQMYYKWREDPASRPVRTITAAAKSPAAGASATNRDFPAAPINSQQQQQSSESQNTPASSTATSTRPVWWVVPNILVRVVAESAEDWYGRKCAVKAVMRKENKVRLAEWPAPHVAAGGSSSPASPASPTNSGFPLSAFSSSSPRTPQPAAVVVDIIGLDGLETVIPKKGGTALVVLGEKRGELVTVQARVRGADGDLAAVEVKASRTGEVFQLAPHELCELARR